MQLAGRNIWILISIAIGIYLLYYFADLVSFVLGFMGTLYAWPTHYAFFA